ncbi:MAG: LysR family transcriptional regulator, partial [Gammaproteobacteria bacterium]|nr:LysR family transcriptional regulator [Gammaproteobacteria bacterium]
MEPIDDMRLFARLVELRSFTAVAAAEQVARSLVSKRITRLEDHLGVQLLNRTTRRLE